MIAAFSIRGGVCGVFYMLFPVSLTDVASVGNDSRDGCIRNCTV